MRGLRGAEPPPLSPFVDPSMYMGGVTRMVQGSYEMLEYMINTQARERYRLRKEIGPPPEEA